MTTMTSFFFLPASPTNFVTICVVHFFQPGLDICFIFVLFLLTWVGGEALSFGGFLSNASPSRGKLRIGFMFLQRDLIFSKNNLLMFKNYLIQTSFDFFRHTRNPSRTQFSASAQSIQQKPIKKQNGSLWGGEFSAKIFLKHWYLQCFPAMKALKPLF